MQAKTEEHETANGEPTSYSLETSLPTLGGQDLEDVLKLYNSVSVSLDDIGTKIDVPVSTWLGSVEQNLPRGCPEIIQLSVGQFR